MKTHITIHDDEQGHTLAEVKGDAPGIIVSLTTLMLENEQFAKLLLSSVELYKQQVSTKKQQVPITKKSKK